MQEHILILGGGYGGMITAVRLAKLTKSKEVAITLVNARDTFAERIRFHQMASGQMLKQRRIVDMLPERVNFVQGVVTGIQPDKRLVTVQQNEGVTQLTYDRLVYALGSVIDRDSVPGIRNYAYTLDYSSLQALRDVLPQVAARGGRMVVVGGGLTGIEAATEFAETYPGLLVKMTTGGELAVQYSPKARTHLRKVFKRLGIQLTENTRIQRITSEAVITSKGAIPFDVCLWAGGFAMLPLAREAGITTDSSGRILIGADMRSLSHPDIYGVGDAADFAPNTGIQIRMACATALPMGGHTAESIAAELHGKQTQPFDLGYVFHCISLGRHDGLIQFVTKSDQATDRVLTGRRAVVVKEMICRYAFGAIKWENVSHMLRYRWPGSGKSPKIAHQTVEVHSEQPA